MKLETKETLWNYLMLLGVLIIIISSIFIIYFYFNSKNNDCLNNPLVYGAKQLTKRNSFNYEFIGYGFFQTPPNKKMPTVTFNSEYMNFSYD